MTTRKRLSLADKIKIIDDYNDKRTLNEICIKHGIVKSSVCTIIKNQKKILKSVRATQTGSLRRLSLRKGEYPKMEAALYKWFVTQRESHVPINGNILKIKAVEIQKKIYGDRGFLSSNGWLTKFKKRFGIRLLKESGEKLSSRVELVEPFKKKFSELIKENNLSLDAVFNADESGLYWKMLPNSTYVHAGETSAPGRKLSKERLTFLACSNASGSKKIRPLVIGKAKNPRSFKNKIIPIDYTFSKSAWMNASIFKNWVFSKFVPQVG